MSKCDQSMLWSGAKLALLRLSLAQQYSSFTGALGLIDLALMYVFMALTLKNFRKGLREKGGLLEHSL